MKIARAEIENFQKITVVDIEFGDGVTEISGKNGAGKSSVFKALHAALDQRATPADPIRHGADTAVIRIHLDDGNDGLLYVKKRYRNRPDGEVDFDLEISTPDGGIYDKAATLLKKMLGAHLLDPLEFINMKPDAQLEILKRFVPGFDFDANAREYKGVFTRRTTIGQEYEREKGAAEAIRVPDDTPAAIIEVGELSAEVERAVAHNTDIKLRSERRADARKDIAEWRDTAQGIDDALPAKITAIENLIAAKQKQIDDEIAALQAKKEALAKEGIEQVESEKVAAVAAAAKYRLKADELEARLTAAGDLPAVIPEEQIQSVREKIANATRLNAQVNDRISRDKHAAAAKALDQRYAECTKKLTEIEKVRQDAIANSRLPIPALGFGDGCITLNGAPFKQASQGEKMRTAVALVAASQSGELRFCWVSDASLLDDDNRALIEQLSQEYDLQTLIETVRPGSSNAIVLEDGHVKGVEAEPKLTKVAKPAADAANDAPDAPATATAPKSRKRWQGPGAAKGDAS